MNDLKIKYYDEEIDIFNEVLMVSKTTFTATLSRIPSNRKILISHGYTSLTEVDAEPNINEFKVDRNTGEILFNSAMAGEKLIVDYHAIGKFCVSADNVSTNVDSNGNVIETLEGYLQKNKEIIDSVNTIGDGATVFNQLEAHIESAKNLMGNVIEGGNVNDKLVKTINNSKKADTNLNESINSANTKITEMNEWVDQYGDIVNLDNRVDGVEAHIPKINEQLETITNDIADINLLPQGTLPSKQSISSCSKKLALKESDDVYKIIQATNKGYIAHTFQKGLGDSSSASVGGNYELIRLIKSEQINEVFLWLEPSPTTGTLTTSIAPSEFNGVETMLITSNTTNSINNISGLSLYDLANGESATFEFTTRKNNLANIMYLSSTNRSENVEISINNTVVKNINSNKGYAGGYYNIESFNVPSHSNASTKFTVKLENKGSKKFSFVCFNFFKLKEFNGEEVNSFKAYKKNKEFIHAVGSSDYAIRDKDLGKWCGSYHGGEIAEQQKITWNLSDKHGDDTWNLETLIADIPVGRFTVVDDFRIIQKTNINNKATMTSIFDFNIDGTINMNFGLTGNTIKATDIYTALTCASTKFTFLTYPNIININQNANTNLEIQNGYVEQYSNEFNMKLGIRYNIFNNKYNTLGTYITHNKNYAKFYYGVVTGYNEGIIIPNLTFSKALDFYNILL